MVDYSPALMTDMYEYTMLDASLKDGTANRKCVFEVYTRHLPEGRRYGVVAGIGRILDELSRFLLSDEDLRFLSDRKVVSKETISWLENLHFSGSIKGYREGEMFFPNSPMNMFCNRYLLRRMFISRLWHHVRKFKAAS